MTPRQQQLALKKTPDYRSRRHTGARAIAPPTNTQASKENKEQPRPSDAVRQLQLRNSDAKCAGRWRYPLWDASFPRSVGTDRQATCQASTRTTDRPTTMRRAKKTAIGFRTLKKKQATNWRRNPNQRKPQGSLSWTDTQAQNATIGRENAQNTAIYDINC